MNISRNVLITIFISIVINYAYAKPTRSLSQENKFPISIRVLNEGNLKYGSVFSVECSTEADVISIKWVRESLKTRAYYSQYNNAILMTINSIIPMDFGKYTCVATRADSVQVSSSIRIERNPNFGNRFRYRLDSDKQSGGKAEELKSDKLIANKDKNNNNNNNNDNNDNDNDNDNNNNESSESSDSNTVHGSISDQTEVRIAQEFQTYTHEGETVSFTCLINDENRTDIAWTRNHGAMPPTHKIVDNTLILCNVTHEDTGYYICSYKEKSTYVYLGLVRGGLPITYVKIPSKAKQINVIEGDEVEIDCQVVGELPTDLRWEKHQSSLPDNVIVEYNKLKIKSVRIDNYGYYECLGQNVLGNFSDFVYLDIKNKSEVLLARERVTQVYYPDEEEGEETVSVVATTTTNPLSAQEENTENETETNTDLDQENNQNEDDNENNNNTNNNDGDVSNEVTETNEDVEVEANQNDSITTTPPVSADEPAANQNEEQQEEAQAKEESETPASGNEAITTQEVAKDEESSSSTATEETPMPEDPTPSVAETEASTDSPVAEEESAAAATASVTESVQEETVSTADAAPADVTEEASSTDAAAAVSDVTEAIPSESESKADEPAAEESVSTTPPPAEQAAAEE